MSILISSPSMGIGWLKTLSCIIEKGNNIFDGDVKLKEYISIVLDISDPNHTDSIMEVFWASQFVYNPQITQIGLFDYRSRIFSYNGIDQIAIINDRLSKKRESKSATAITLLPGKDIEKVPCLISVDFKIRDNKLVTQAFFRSQDVWNKQPLNLLFLKDITSSLSNSLSAPLGSITLYIASAHIYDKDFDTALNFIRRYDG